MNMDKTVVYFFGRYISVNRIETGRSLGMSVLRIAGHSFTLVSRNGQGYLYRCVNGRLVLFMPKREIIIPEDARLILARIYGMIK